MKSERTICVFFDDLTPKAQKRIITMELETATNQDVSDIGIKDDNMEPYGYNQDPDKQEMLQDIHVEVTYGGKQHYWLMVWDCMEAKFQTIMEEQGVSYNGKEVITRTVGGLITHVIVGYIAAQVPDEWKAKRAEIVGISSRINNNGNEDWYYDVALDDSGIIHISKQDGGIGQRPYFIEETKHS